MKEKTERQLAAVMFADIVGYSAMMQEDEAAASIARARHREVFEQQHEIHHGKIIQYYGDGALSVFRSAIEAAKCAMAIQHLLQIGDPVPLRIGLHLGDIVFNKTEVYGDGVNLASRIEHLGVAGAILLSSKVNDELKNHRDISTISLGIFELKNIMQPIEVFAIVNEGIVVPQPQELKGKKKEDSKTIAVLPFVNLSSNEENEFFSDGITEEIINALAKIDSLRVTSRTSAFVFKHKTIPVTQIAAELKVSTILEGSVRLAGNTLRITAQLIEAKNDFHFWSETWDRPLDNIFEIQDEISLIIADKLREQFGHLEIQEHLVEKQTNNINAYELSLKAKYHRNKWNPQDVREAISLYEKALVLDSNHTESWVGLADCYSFLGTTGFMSFEEAWEKSHQYTRKALSLNDQISGIHYLLSNEAFFIECDYKKSLIEMKKAVALNPNNAEAQQFLSFLYIVSGNKEKSREHLDIALSINPLSEETQFFSGYYFYMIEDYEKAIELLNKCLAANDKNIPAHSIKAICMLKLKRYDDVISYFDKIPKDVIILGEKTGAIALAYALKKDKANTEKYLNSLMEQSKGPNGFTADSYLFMMHVAMGEIDKAFDWISIAIKSKSSLLLIRFADPLVRKLEKDTRYLKYKKIIFNMDEDVQTDDSKKALLDDAQISFYREKLLKHLVENKPYLESDLSLRALATQLKIHPNQLSWLLNESLGKNFNEFINHYRVETFKTLSRDPKNAHLTIMGLAYDSGFNSKTAFNTYFKKETGLTPKQFLKQTHS